MIKKHAIEKVIIAPLIWIGRLVAFFSAKKEYEIYFFFPFYHTGGAEKVHCQIANAVKNKKAIIYFTRKSHNQTLLDSFKATGHKIADISFYTDNKFLYFLNIIYRGYLSGLINKQNNKPVVMNGQCNFGYKISPWIRQNIKQVELIHSFNSFSYIRVPYIQYYAQTVMISKKKIEEHLAYYEKIKIPSGFAKKIIHINNAIAIDDSPIEKDNQPPFIVLYVGRNSPEKRIHIVIELARQFYSVNSLIKFQFLGIENGEIEATPNCEFLGNISDFEVIKQVYKKAHCLLLTSSTEGFPMVVIEAMAHQCAVIATAVGDIPLHINKENGYIIDDYMNEPSVINEAYKGIANLEKNPLLLKKMCVNNYQYAKEYFSLDTFNFAYQKILEN